MKGNRTNNAYIEDGLELLDEEIGELENDKLSVEEAGFLFDYEAKKDEDEWWAKEEALLRQTEERLGEAI